MRQSCVGNRVLVGPVLRRGLLIAVVTCGRLEDASLRQKGVERVVLQGCVGNRVLAGVILPSRSRIAVVTCGRLENTGRGEKGVERVDGERIVGATRCDVIVRRWRRQRDKISRGDMRDHRIGQQRLERIARRRFTCRRRWIIMRDCSPRYCIMAVGLVKQRVGHRVIDRVVMASAVPAGDAVGWLRLGGVGLVARALRDRCIEQQRVKGLVLTRVDHSWLCPDPIAGRRSCQIRMRLWWIVVERLFEKLVLDVELVGNLVREGRRGVIHVGMCAPVLDSDVNDLVVAAVPVTHRIAPSAQGPLRAKRPASQPGFFGAGSGGGAGACSGRS